MINPQGSAVSVTDFPDNSPYLGDVAEANAHSFILILITNIKLNFTHLTAYSIYAYMWFTEL